jgi:hypothetical protein
VPAAAPAEVSGQRELEVSGTVATGTLATEPKAEVVSGTGRREPVSGTTEPETEVSGTTAPEAEVSGTGVAGGAEETEGEDYEAIEVSVPARTPARVESVGDDTLVFGPLDDQRRPSERDPLRGESLLPARSRDTAFRLVAVENVQARPPAFGALRPGAATLRSQSPSAHGSSRPSLRGPLARAAVALVVAGGAAYLVAMHPPTWLRAPVRGWLEKLPRSSPSAGLGDGTNWTGDPRASDPR